MAARILILQEEPSPFLALRTSLESEHELIMVSTVENALKILESEPIDLIISRVHLARGSVFEFLNHVEEDPSLAKIPFICFCGQLSQHSLLLDPLMAKVGLMTGAEKYITLREFCRKGICDTEALKEAIEDCLRQDLRSAGGSR